MDNPLITGPPVHKSAPGPLQRLLTPADPTILVLSPSPQVTHTSDVASTDLSSPVDSRTTSHSIGSKSNSEQELLKNVKKLAFTQTHSTHTFERLSTIF